MKTKQHLFPEHLTRQNPGSDGIFRNFWSLATATIEAAPNTLTVRWVYEVEVGRALAKVKPNSKLSENEWRHNLRIHILQIRKHWLELDHFFDSNQMKFAATLSGALSGLEEGNYLVACSMLRSAIENTAWLNQFMAKHVRLIEAGKQADRIETESFFKFRGELAKTLYPTRYDFSRFDEQGRLREPQDNSGKTKPWEYKAADGKVDRRVSSILSSIERLEKILPGSGEMYERICEFVHPNVGTQLLISNQESIEYDRNGVQHFCVTLQPHFAQFPAVVQIVLPDMLNFGALLITHFNALVAESIPYRDAYQKLGRRVSQQALKKNRKLFDPYSDCPCQSEKKFRFCCGKD
jgi:hypothetical protein